MPENILTIKLLHVVRVDLGLLLQAVVLPHALLVPQANTQLFQVQLVLLIQQLLSAAIVLLESTADRLVLSAAILAI